MTERDTNVLAKAKLRATIWSKTDGICWYCGEKTNPWLNFCIDHIIPVSMGGMDNLKNLVPCCRSCNAKKGTRDIEYLRQRLTEISFSKKELEYLKDSGFDINKLKPYIFYFERMEIKP